MLFAQVYQQAGWLLPTLCLVVLGVASALATCFLIELMARIPNNGRFQQRVEYSGVMKHYCNTSLFRVTFLFYQLSLLCTNIALIVQTVQVMDFALAAMLNRSCVMPQFWPQFFFGCPDALVDHETVFVDNFVGISLGWIVTALFVLPLAAVNLDDNIAVQQGAFVTLFIIICVWSGLFIDHGLDSSRVPLVGNDFTNVMGTCLFNFALLSSVPSWINDKHPKVRVSHVLLVSIPTAVVTFFAVGLFCALSFEPWNDATNLLQRLLSLKSTVGNISFYLFPVVANATSIPVTSIFQRLNLIEQGCPESIANLLAVVLPWIVAIPLYSGQGFDELSIVSGLLFTSAVNFLFVPAIYAYVAWQDIVHKKKKIAPASDGMLHESLLSSDSDAPASDTSHSLGLDSESESKDAEQHAVSQSADSAIADADADRWRFFEPQYEHWRLPVSISVLVLMVLSVAVTAVLQVQQSLFAPPNPPDIDPPS